MSKTKHATHAGLVDFWQEIILSMVNEGTDPDLVTNSMLEVAIAGRLALVGPACLAEGLAQASDSARRLVVSAMPSTEPTARVH